jgi:hypothetical protein
VPVAQALYVAEESYGARPVSGFADAPEHRDDIVAGFLTIQIIQTILDNTWQYMAYCHNISFLIIIYIVRRLVL